MKNNTIIPVNINDIEDIVLAKVEIDKNNPETKGRSPLNDFINIYCKINWLLIYNDISIPFEIKDIFNINYVFYSCDNANNEKILFEFLKKIRYDINNLKQLSTNKILEEGIANNTIYIIINNNYFTVKN